MMIAVALGLSLSLVLLTCYLLPNFTPEERAEIQRGGWRNVRPRLIARLGMKRATICLIVRMGHTTKEAQRLLAEPGESA